MNISAASREYLQRFQNDGYFIIRDVLSPECLEAARREILTLVDEFAARLMARGVISEPLRDEPFDTRLYKLCADHLDMAPTQFRAELHREGFFDVFFNPVLLDLVEMIVGPEVRLYPNYTVRPKLPDWEKARVPWHQDGGLTAEFYHLDAREKESVGIMRMANVWAPLVPATVRNGCMQFIPGTHLLGVVPHEKKDHYDGEIVAEHLEPHLQHAIPIELNPGDVVVFHNLLFHQGLPNRSKAIRWSMDWRYQDASQSTLRAEKGHLARSLKNPALTVRSPGQWASLNLT